MKTENFAVREVKNAANYARENTTNKSIVIVYPQWAILGFTYHFAPNLFKHTKDYYPTLNKNGILPIWGYDAMQ